MPREINVNSFTQRVVVTPTTNGVSLINAGPMGPRGPVGEVSEAQHDADIAVVQAAADAAQATADAAAYVEASDPATGELVIAGVQLGDTGWRDVEADLLKGTWTAIRVYLRRTGNAVDILVAGLKANGGGDAECFEFSTIGTGFLPAGPASEAARLVVPDISANFYRTFYTGSSFSIHNGHNSPSSFYFNFRWITDDAWPASLPGTPV